MRLCLFAIFTIPVLSFAAPTVKAKLQDVHRKSIGSATFTQVKEGVRVAVTITGISPGAHALHVHAVGACEGPDFDSAGDHFNPDSKEHGLDNPHGAHLGDMPNITVNAGGIGTARFVLRGVTLDQGPGSLLREGGTALVLHAQPDDMKSDPAGNAGARIACGVVARQR
jgi:Cu-Zn family superoxide dismutase